MRRWFRFKLRTLLVAFAVSSLPLSWVAYNANLVRQRHALRQMIGSGKTGKHWEMANEIITGTHPAEVTWIRRILGDWPAVGFSWDSNADVDRELLKRMHERFPEAIIVTRRRLPQFSCRAGIPTRSAIPRWRC